MLRNLPSRLSLKFRIDFQAMPCCVCDKFPCTCLEPLNTNLDHDPEHKNEFDNCLQIDQEDKATSCMNTKSRDRHLMFASDLCTEYPVSPLEM